MTTIRTKQNYNGKFWCNATIDGYDHFIEANTIQKAQEDFKKLLINKKDVKFLEVEFYKNENLSINKNIIGYSKTRIDLNPIG